MISWVLGRNRLWVLLVFTAVTTWKAVAGAPKIVEGQAAYVVSDPRVLPKLHSSRLGAHVPSTKRPPLEPL